MTRVASHSPASRSNDHRNGLLMLAADAIGVGSAHELTAADYRLPEVSYTFHARDVFAPAAAHVAAGVAVDALGPAVEPSTLVRLDVPVPQLGRSQVRATVLVVDRFGNVATNVHREHLTGLGVADGDRIEVRLALDRYYAIVSRTFADAQPGELILYEDSYGLVTLAISRGDAARLTGVRAGDEMRLALA